MTDEDQTEQKESTHEDLLETYPLGANYPKIVNQKSVGEKLMYEVQSAVDKIEWVSAGDVNKVLRREYECESRKKRAGFQLALQD